MIYAIFAMLVLTFTVAGYLLKLRVVAVRSGEVRLSSFRLNNDENIPVKMQQAARNYSNLFEMPVFFYAAGVIAVALHLDNLALTLLAWIFVITRIAHSWIHLTSNNVIRRMQAFMVGNACVILIWVILMWEYSFSIHYML